MVFPAKTEKMKRGLCFVSIPSRGLWFFPQPMFQRLTVFSFQGAVTVLDRKSIISATDLSRGKKINIPKNQSQQPLQSLR